MNPWLVLTIVLFSMLAGAVVVGLLVFFFVLLQNVKKLTNTVEAFMKGMDQKAIGRLAATITAIAMQGDKIIVSMSELTKAAQIINKTFFNRAVMGEGSTRTTRPNIVTPGVDDDADGEMAEEGESDFHGLSEEDAARNEKFSELKKQGINVDDREGPNPPEETVVRVES